MKIFFMLGVRIVLNLNYQTQNILMLVSWAVMVCRLAGRYKYFGGTYCHHLQSFSFEMVYLFTSPCNKPEDQNHYLYYPEVFKSHHQTYLIVKKFIKSKFDTHTH
jgi:hypothetical protein